MTPGTALRAILGIALLTLMDVVIKAQMQQHPFLLALFMRFAMGGLCAVVVLAFLRPAFPTRASLIGNSLRVPVVILTAGSFFYSVSVLPLAEALTLSFLAPVFVALLGALILKERLDGRILQALGFGLAGMLVMVWPRLQGGDEVGHGAATLALHLDQHMHGDDRGQPGRIDQRHVGGDDPGGAQSPQPQVHP